MEPQNLQMQELYQELEDFEKKGVPIKLEGSRDRQQSGRFSKSEIDKCNQKDG